MSGEASGRDREARRRLCGRLAEAATRTSARRLDGRDAPPGSSGRVEQRPEAREHPEEET